MGLEKFLNFFSCLKKASSITCIHFPDHKAFALFIIAVLNLIFVCWDTGLRRSEMRTRVKWVQQFLNEWRGKCDWKPENYPHVHSPQSPSITLQPAFRDGRLVNLPWALLVKGDVIILRPGQSAPGRCRSLQVRQSQSFVYESREMI